MIFSCAAEIGFYMHSFVFATNFSGCKLWIMVTIFLEKSLKSDFRFDKYKLFYSKIIQWG